MALVAGLRYEVGTDYNHTYVPNFMTALTKNDQYSEVPFFMADRTSTLYVELFSCFASNSSKA